MAAVPVYRPPSGLRTTLDDFKDHLSERYQVKLGESTPQMTPAVSLGGLMLESFVESNNSRDMAQLAMATYTSFRSLG
jgi:hypothetical protein